MEENHSTDKLAFQSLDRLIHSFQDGSITEILEDWRWIFGYSKRYKFAIAFYILLGIISTSLGLISSVAGKYLIDIVTGYHTDQLGTMILIMGGSMVFSLVFDSLINRLTTRLSIQINNDIQADIFDKIMDADWLSLSQYSNGDVLNRFNNDISTVSGNAISWLPTIVIALYRFVATFL